MAQDLLRELHRSGIRIRLVDGRLDVRAPTGALTPQLRAQLQQHRDELVALLDGAATAADLAEITPQPEQEHEPFPLTDIQHAYWVGRSNAVELGGVATHYYFELDSQGLDPHRLTGSLRAVIARHGMLRAIVEPDGRQRILPEVPPYEITVHDLRSLPLPAREQTLAQVRAALAHRAPPPERWPLFAIQASLLPDRRIRLHLSFNILIVDFASLALLFRDWRHCYQAPDSPLPPTVLSYRDYVVTQERLRGGARFRRAEKYWLSRLDTLPAAPDLPLARPPAQLATAEFTRRHARLPQPRWNRFAQAAQQHGVTPSVALLTAFADVLRKWSTRPGAFTLNLTLFDRPPLHPAISELIGDFTSLTMLAVDPTPDEPFAGRAARLGRQLLRDLEHLSYSGVRVLRERARRLGGGPGAAMPVVFTSAIGTDRGPRPAAEDRRFFGELGYGISQTPQVWLDHQVMEDHGDLVFNWDTVEKLFPAGMLDDMFTSYCTVLNRLSTDDRSWEQVAPLASLPEWQLAERAQANRTAQPELGPRTLCALVAEQVRQRPAATAVAGPTGTLTYQQVATHARRLARRLLAHGATTGALVGVVLDKGWEQVPAVLGVSIAGAAYLPIDPQWPPARHEQLLERGGVRLVVTTPALRDALDWPPGIRILTLDDPEVCQADHAPLPAGPAPEDLAYVIFTSGSTGEPKGVMIDHRGAANTVADINARYRVGPGDRVLALSALSFDLSVYDIFGTLAAGATVVLPSAARVHDPAHWTEVMQREQVTVWNSVPALLQAWVDSRAGRGSSPPGLRLALLSGDWIPTDLPAAIRWHYPDIEVISLGGATEASIWSVCYPVGEVPAHWRRIPYGKPLSNQTLHVYDDQLAPCPVWTTGEIYIGGVGVAKGYWADPVRTAERFVTHPNTGELIYRTGDLGRYLPGGDIEFLGREDNQVKINGYRIELAEIATALRQQPGVAEALVRVATNPATAARQLVAYVVTAPGGGADEAGLRAALEATLPSYLLPQHYLLIDQLPLSPNGKVDPSALPDPWHRITDPAQVAPRDELELSLLRIWREVLERDDFGVTDNFFELGADSLHAVRIIGRLRDELSVALSEADEGLQTLFESPTVAELAQALRSQDASAPEPR